LQQLLESEEALVRPPAVPLADKRKAPTAEQVQRRREEEEAVSVSLRKLEKKLDPRGAGGDRGDSSSEEVADCV
jgi:hypothetical protein